VKREGLAVEAYLEDGTLPAKGAVCRQEVPFAAPEPDPAAAEAGGASLIALRMKARLGW
jgi:hypothetical protein